MDLHLKNKNNPISKFFFGLHWGLSLPHSHSHPCPFQLSYSLQTILLPRFCCVQFLGKCGYFYMVSLFGRYCNMCWFLNPNNKLKDFLEASTHYNHPMHWFLVNTVSVWLPRCPLIHWSTASSLERKCLKHQANHTVVYYAFGFIKISKFTGAFIMLFGCLHFTFPTTLPNGKKTPVLHFDQDVTKSAA